MGIAQAECCSCEQWDRQSALSHKSCPPPPRPLLFALSKARNCANCIVHRWHSARCNVWGSQCATCKMPPHVPPAWSQDCVLLTVRGQWQLCMHWRTRQSVILATCDEHACIIDIWWQATINKSSVPHQCTEWSPAIEPFFNQPPPPTRSFLGPPPPPEYPGG